MSAPGRKTAEAQRAQSGDPKIELGLNAAIVTVRAGQPHILVVRSGTAGSGTWDALPFGPFAPRAHRTLEIGLREWVKRQTGLDLGYVEQLYTFGDRGRHAEPGGAHTLSVGYLALTRGAGDELLGSHWSPWYAYFPWEDWREGKPDILTDEIEPRLKEWAARPPLPDEPARPLRRQERLRISFGIGGTWDEEKVLERYELLYEAGLVAEAKRDGRPAAKQWPVLPAFGRPMAFDHRRILATALGRLRGKLKYRPVVFELLPGEFTLLELQKTVESISGTLLHKQNFRRLVEQGGLVEATGNVSTATGGRPARLYRFRREVVVERPALGLRVKAGRG
jgi:hypothetical protein